jgi:hypothetical protein
MKITSSPKQRTIETTEPELDSRTIAQLSCGLIEDLLIHPLQRTGHLSSEDLSTIQQVQGVISMLGEKAGTLEDLLEGKSHRDSVN